MGKTYNKKKPAGRVPDRLLKIVNMTGCDYTTLVIPLILSLSQAPTSSTGC